MLKKNTWERHVNPWSVWTRVPLLPLLALAMLLRGPLGVWTWPLLAILIVWTLANPKAFPPPASTDHWASRGVLGERVWLNRRKVPIPPHHARWALGLSLSTGLFLIPLVWGSMLSSLGRPPLEPSAPLWRSYGSSTGWSGFTRT